MGGKGWLYKSCMMCARVGKRDMDRGYCPVTASNIHPNKPADKCKFFDMSEDWMYDGKYFQRRRNVR